MKRKGNLYDQMCSIDNILLADSIARRGKSRQSGVINFDKNYDQNIADLYRELVTNTYKTSPYRTRIINEGKERKISILPYRDRVIQHNAMIVLEPIFVSTFTTDTYSCIKGKGIHDASWSLQKALKDVEGTTYCLKMDITKFYPSVDHDILKVLLRKKIKDKEMLHLLDGIIDSAPGLPIGNYLSQYFANFYLTYFDHWIKEQKAVKYYFRYADDIVILHSDKAYLQRALAGITKYLDQRLKLKVKGNWQIFPVKSRGIDFVGYVHYHTHLLMRKSIKKNFARKVAKGINKLSLASYLGWAKHCNSRHLIRKLAPQYEKILKPRDRAA
ncbi:reverse transcriptase/maturase family protein [Pedobacter gandavensis]|uniref:Reverse transcriptase n=1 Tax=Pedobacter gandavensis TaxID=2679963 RepID=A0ABR6EVW4_9SPHI|nr:reverse transcriptase/maturase family protein [Pedobacter gandavensis]MBB2149157.1 reverse transcriptase [Pedobacter gandavensis]